MELDKKAYFVVTGSFVTAEDGTGIVHIAPAFGADDMEMARQFDLPVLRTVDEEGHFIDEVTLMGIHGGVAPPRPSAPTPRACGPARAAPGHGSPG